MSSFPPPFWRSFHWWWIRVSCLACCLWAWGSSWQTSSWSYGAPARWSNHMRWANGFATRFARTLSSNWPSAQTRPWSRFSSALESFSSWCSQRFLWAQARCTNRARKHPGAAISLPSSCIEFDREWVVDARYRKFISIFYRDSVQQFIMSIIWLDPFGWVAV